MSTTPENLLAALALTIRRELEGSWDEAGRPQPGNLERRLAGMGIRAGRKPVPVAELPRLTAEDRDARSVVEAFLASRAGAGIEQVRSGRRTAGQTTRRSEIVKAREGLAELSARLQGIDTAGFACEPLASKLAEEPLDAWTSRVDAGDKAIVDRATFRADERRWCREGKLPRPGWWKGGEEA